MIGWDFREDQSASAEADAIDGESVATVPLLSEALYVFEGVSAAIKGDDVVLCLVCALMEVRGDGVVADSTNEKTPDEGGQQVSQVHGCYALEFMRSA